MGGGISFDCNTIGWRGMVGWTDGGQVCQLAEQQVESNGVALCVWCGHGIVSIERSDLRGHPLINKCRVT